MIRQTTNKINKSNFRNKVLLFTKSYKQKSVRLSRKIWRCPEKSGAEHYAHQLLRKQLRKAKFQLKTSVLPTGFSAAFGKQDAPCVAFLGEYDALRGVHPSQPYLFTHACGHNLLGVASLTAALVLARIIKKHNLNLRVAYYGCPAEEEGAGKVQMVKNKEFSGVNAVFTWHPAAKNAVCNDTWLGSKVVELTFQGRLGHSSLSRTKGGDPNKVFVVFARLFSNLVAPLNSLSISGGSQTTTNISLVLKVQVVLRGFSEQKIIQAYKELLVAVEKTRTETKGRIVVKQKEFYPPTTCDTTMQSIIANNLRFFIPHQIFSARDYAISKKVLKNILLAKQKANASSMNIPASFLPTVLNTKLIHTKNKTFVYAPTDVGAVAKVCPTGQFHTVCMPVGVGVHTSAASFFAQHNVGHKGMFLATQVLVGSALEWYFKQSLKT